MLEKQYSEIIEELNKEKNEIERLKNFVRENKDEISKLEEKYSIIELLKDHIGEFISLGDNKISEDKKVVKNSEVKVKSANQKKTKQKKTNKVTKKSVKKEDTKEKVEMPNVDELNKIKKLIENYRDVITKISNVTLKKFYEKKINELEAQLESKLKNINNKN